MFSRVKVDDVVTQRPLHDGWTVAAVNRSNLGRVPATVPGCVHTDLLAAGQIPDPYHAAHEKELAWIGRTDWVYETSFDWAPNGAERTDLVCAGLDTIATIALNGVELGTTANMHRSYRFDAASALSEGANRLTVRFDAPLQHAEALDAEAGDRPHSYDHPFNVIRKMACNFGWDWGPVLVTSGIWRPIGLESWSTARLASVRPLVTVDGETGRVEVHVSVERATEAPLTVTASVEQRPTERGTSGGPSATRQLAGQASRATLPAGESSTVLQLSVPDVRRWWPRGHGEQARYELRVELRDADATRLDHWQRQIGFRTVKLDTEPDEIGTPYTLIVNDLPIFVRGFNWIPDDCFPHRVTPQRYRDRLTAAAEANANFLRVWGGGIYESDDFYDVCDELGLMVGQDFLLCCAAYAEEPPLRDEIIAEATENVARLAPHPSLVWWNGNNECIWGHEDWGWKERLGDLSWGGGYYLDVLPKVVDDVDPTRPYWPGSPYSGSPDVHPNDPAHGTSHIWEPWVETQDYTDYRAVRPRFAAEYGYQAPAAYATLREAIGADGMDVTSPTLINRQKAPDGQEKLARGIAGRFPASDTDGFDQWMWLTQLNQARAVSAAVEHFRSLRGECMGSVVWQLNDCWPAISWSAVDSAGRRKPLWYALARAYADRLLTIQPREDGLVLVAANDGIRPWRRPVPVRRYDLSGRELAVTVAELDVAPLSVQTIPLPASVVTADNPAAELLLAGDTGWWFFADDAKIAWPRAEYEASVAPVDGGLAVTVTAQTIVRDLTMFPDRLDPAASVDAALVTLLPGETVTFGVRTDADLDHAALTVPPVLRCVNDVGLDG
jgi:beta-mannosidase